MIWVNAALTRRVSVLSHLSGSLMQSLRQCFGTLKVLWTMRLFFFFLFYQTVTEVTHSVLHAAALRKMCQKVHLLELLPHMGVLSLSRTIFFFLFFPLS